MHVLCAAAHLQNPRFEGEERAFRLHQRQSPSREGPKCCIVLRILEGDTDSGKKMILEHLRRKILLNENRELYPCHTFQTDVSEIASAHVQPLSQ